MNAPLPFNFINLNLSIMALDLLHPETLTWLNRPKSNGKLPSAKKKSLTGGGEIPTSEELTGIELRLLPPYIIENNTPKVFPFPGFAKLYCLVLVVSDVNNQLVGGIDLQGFARVGDREHIPISKTLFYWESGGEEKIPPKQIHILCSVIKSKEGLRNVGEILTKIKSDTDYKDLMSTLSKMAKTASGIGMTLDLLGQVGAVVGKYLGKVEDKPLGSIIQSFTALRGDFDNKGVHKRGYPTRNVNFELELIIRDRSAQPKTEHKMAVSKGVVKSARKIEKEKVEVDLQPLL